MLSIYRVVGGHLLLSHNLMHSGERKCHFLVSSSVLLFKHMQVIIHGNISQIKIKMNNPINQI